MYIEEICIEGFKSYAQRTVVPNFDPKFNAITGLNGSGKSNILDSICFVLGITNLQQVRASNLQELVYKQGQAGVTKATVSVVFNNSDRASSPVGYEDQKQITVTRQIVIGGRNKYMINGHVRQPNQVQNLFHSVQLNVNNPHFLIMQGRITKVLNMKPPEILSMLEEAAGTRMYETKKEAALKTLDKKQAKIEEINKLLADEILPALEKLRRERAQYQAWQQGTADIDRLKRFCLAYEFTLAERATSHALENVGKVKAEIEALARREGEIEVEQGRKKRELECMMREREKQMGSGMSEAQQVADRVAEELVKVTSVWRSKKEMVASEKASLKQIAKALAQIQQGSASHFHLAEALQSAVSELQATADVRIKAQADAEVELEAVRAGKTGLPGDDKTVGEKISELKAAAVEAGTEAKQGRMRVGHLEKEVREKGRMLEGKRKAAEGLMRRLEGVEREVEGCERKVQEIGFDAERHSAMDKERLELEPAVSSLRQHVTDATSDLNLSFQFNDPVRGFDRGRVKGMLARLLRIRDAQMAVALEVVAGGKLFNVVVDSEETGKLLLSPAAGLKRRVTIIPLNKIDSRSMTQEVVDRAQRLVGADNVWPALSLVDFDPQLKPAMAYAFGNHFVCRNADIAKKVAFHPDIMAPCVTLEGDSYVPSGLLTGGSRRGGGALLTRLHAIQSEENKLAAMEERLSTILAQLSAMEGQKRAFESAHASLQLKSHTLRLLREQVAGSEHQQLADEVASRQAELAECHAAVEAAEQREKEVSSQWKEMEADAEKRGRERGKRVKELEGRVKAAKQEAAAAVKALKEKQAELSQLAVDTESARAEEAAAKEAAAAAEAEVHRLEGEERHAREQADAVQAQLREAEGAVGQMRERMRECDEEVKRVEREIEKMGEERATAGMERRKLEHEVKSKEAEQQRGTREVERLLKQHVWIAAERHVFGRPGSDYDFGRTDCEAARRELASKQAEHSSMEQRINKRVMTMFEKAEQECKDLEGKKTTVLSDKSKIEETIFELDEKKKEALKVTWEKVTKDFGSIFSTLLPGTTAKLEPPEGADFLQGLEVRVAFGGVWKQSLTELSGGQRSLLALSLILALLLFKPAPLYILDEVDAALDLNHTQNIGQMIKAHFPHSQFIVVSLKEGMFNNANVIFRTKFVDGVSAVTRTVPSKRALAAAATAAALQAPAPAAATAAAATAAAGRSGATAAGDAATGRGGVGERGAGGAAVAGAAGVRGGRGGAFGSGLAQADSRRRNKARAERGQESEDEMSEGDSMSMESPGDSGKKGQRAVNHRQQRYGEENVEPVYS